MDSRTGDKPIVPARKSGLSLLAAGLIALLVSLVTAMIVVAVYDYRYAQKIVTLDLAGYVRAQRDKVVSGEISDEELRKNLDAMERALMAEPANHVVLLKEVVLRNAGEIKP